MTIADVINKMEQWAPGALQESYDNAGLIVGDKSATVSGVVVCLDTLEAVVEEAIAKGCNLVVAHHPIVFSGLKKITGRNYIERVLLKAIKNDVAIYCAHTNLDNVRTGVNAKICDKIGLQNSRILSPKPAQMQKIVVFVPNDALEKVRKAMFENGAGAIGDYSECSFSASGHGTYTAGEEAAPYAGKIGQRHTEPESKLEVVCNAWQVPAIVGAMKAAHPYEEVAYEVYALQNTNAAIGSGMVGELEKAVPILDFLNIIKVRFGVEAVRYTEPNKDLVQRIAVCGGSGSFLLGAAKSAKADVFITADYKYHQFFDADGQIVIADIGHYESEQFTIDLMVDFLKQNFNTFAVHFTGVNTNPVKYL